MEKRNFNGILKTENGKGIRVDLPTTDEKFKELLGSLTDGDLSQPWGISGFSVSHPVEAAGISQAKSLSEINYYCAVVKNFTEQENALFTAILDAGFCREGNFDDLVNHALNIKNFTFFPGVPDAYTLGKKILEANSDGELPPEEDADKVTWLGEYVCSQTCGRFASGCYIEPTENYELLYDGPADIPECFRISVPFWPDEPK